MVERSQCMLILTIVLVCVAFTCSDSNIPQPSANASDDKPVSSDTQGSVDMANSRGENHKNESDIGKENKEEKEEVASTVTEETMVDNSTGAKEVELVTTETEETTPLDNSLELEKKEKGKYNESTEERKEEEEGDLERREVNIETVESTKETEGDKQGENDSTTLSGQDKDTSSGQDEATNSSSEDQASSINDTESSEPDDIVTFEEFKNRASQELNQPIKQPQGITHPPLILSLKC
ncbi:PREDICTED: uncharacterized protein LOC105315756 [Amphimedon queenslandica]|uniref:Uncharacterized protein n=2 Tax=Amphimedon queenslandica TaxID=400682 RepID=A0AAN0ISQ6_AMPQE|nr:PREDICTED: uncharacterized protein LOC105315756 [Amphimedon queenslandica]|eukprot:XP_011408800.2 PREDICTED: uncharacterized protein LOC105315756 [Amphimedon queenslandica]